MTPAVGPNAPSAVGVRGRPAEDVPRKGRAVPYWAAAHLDHNPTNNRIGNLRSLCQGYHLFHDRSHHIERRWITCLLRRALGDLFLGPYSV